MLAEPAEQQCLVSQDKQSALGSEKMFYSSTLDLSNIANNPSITEFNLN